MLLAALIGWTGHGLWRRTAELEEHLDAQQWKSFQIADHLQQTILSLNILVLRYAAYHDNQAWTNFQTVSLELAHWINEQAPVVSSPAERPLFNQIKNDYNSYVSAALAIRKKIYGSRQETIRMAEFSDFQSQSKRILDLGFQLATVHQQALDTFQGETQKSLDVLRLLLFGALAAMLAAGLWLSVVVYHELIAPLRVQLVESRQLVERQEKLASLGMLAAGVAHEIRNPLTAIKAWLYLQQKHLAPGTPEFADAELIGGELNRLERIVKDFLQFARPSEPELAAIAADAPLREARTLMEPELAQYNIQIVLGETPPAQIRADPQQIKQVLINLIQNAADAIEENGTITLRARLDDKWLNDRQTEVVILEVADTGSGIPPEAEKRLFDPFFTTKDFGTGLGLPIAARIVEKHGGALLYQTQVNHGTTFGIILPRIE
jgi:signal transduction histidine kinase